MPNGGRVGLQFLSRELVEEIATLSRMARDILAPDGVQVLARLKNQIERISEKPVGRPHVIKLRPLYTQKTRDYERGARSGGPEVYGKITGVWEIRSTGRKSTGRKRPKTKVCFTGKASTVVELWPAEYWYGREEDRTSRLARWQLDLGAHDSPGSYFHVQILGDCDTLPFPKSVPVPRLPIPFVTPMAAVEFVLGELFQDRWERLASLTSQSQLRWRAIQRRRWRSLLCWQKCVLDQGQSSPWMNLKVAKPSFDQFLSDRHCR